MPHLLVLIAQMLSVAVSATLVELALARLAKRLIVWHWDGQGVLPSFSIRERPGTAGVAWQAVVGLLRGFVAVGVSWLIALLLRNPDRQQAFAAAIIVLLLWEFMRWRSLRRLAAIQRSMLGPDEQPPQVWQSFGWRSSMARVIGSVTAALVLVLTL
jgi:hypothetical protein